MKRIGLIFVVVTAIMFLVYFAGRGTRSPMPGQKIEVRSFHRLWTRFTLKDLEVTTSRSANSRAKSFS